LSFSNEEEMMAEQLLIGLTNIFYWETGDHFDVIIIYDNIVEIHDEQVENFLVINVVSAHFVESVLW
jgi:hypothetical protein